MSVYTRLFMYLNKISIIRAKYMFLMCCAEWSTIFCQLMIASINCLHVNYDGDIFAFLIFVFCVIHIRLGWQYIEDALFGGLNLFNFRHWP